MRVRRLRSSRSLAPIRGSGGSQDVRPSAARLCWVGIPSPRRLVTDRNQSSSLACVCRTPHTEIPASARRRLISATCSRAGPAASVTVRPSSVTVMRDAVAGWPRARRRWAGTGMPSSDTVPPSALVRTRIRVVFPAQVRIALYLTCGKCRQTVRREDRLQRRETHRSGCRKVSAEARLRPRGMSVGAGTVRA